MDELNLERLATTHFELLEAKQDVEHKLGINQSEIIEVLVKEGMFDMFNVNWRRLRTMLHKHR